MDRTGETEGHKAGKTAGRTGKAGKGRGRGGEDGVERRDGGTEVDEGWEGYDGDGAKNDMPLKKLCVPK